MSPQSGAVGFRLRVPAKNKKMSPQAGTAHELGQHRQGLYSGRHVVRAAVREYW